MARISLRNWTIPLALLGLVTLAYGVFIPLLGLYGDDWPYLWVNHVFGPSGYIRFVAWDRPFSAWIYLLATPILGERVWAYHLFLVLLRWMSAVLFWWVLRLVWPRRTVLAALAACLLVVYPGFLQQPIPLEFMLHFGVLALFLLSVGTMLVAVCRKRSFWLLMAISLVSSAAMFSLEYFVGLELLRPVLLWIVLREQIPDLRQRARRIVLYWLPFLVLLAGFVFWRVAVLQFPSYQPTFLGALKSSPAVALLDLAYRIGIDLKTVVFDAWRNTLNLPSGGRTQVLYLALFSASAILAWVTLWLVKRDENPARRTLIPQIEPIWIGLLALVLAGGPFWVTGLPVQVTFPWDRSSLAFMPGASLVLAGLVDLFPSRLRPVFLALLVGLAVGLHAQNALAYRTESNKLRDFFWQLSWRAPALKPGTIVLSEQIPLYYYSDNSLTPPLNWTYAPGQSSGQQVYNLFDIDERLGGSLPALKENLPIRRTYRSFAFQGNSSNILMVFARAGSCLRVISSQDAKLPGLPPKLSQALELSHLDQISVNEKSAAVPPAHLIGAEPGHTWCYFFEKASLAEQRLDWKEAAALGDQLRQQNLSPSDLSEWLPFVEAYARMGALDQAQAISETVYQQKNLRPALCDTWQKVVKDQPAASEIAKSVRCNQ
jgi:hypothetical protein